MGGARAALRQTMRRTREMGFGVFMLAVAAVCLFVWFPNDISSGFLVVTPGGKIQPGDAFFPNVLAVLMAVLALSQIVSAILQGAPSRAGSGLKLANLRFLGVLFAIVLASILLMFISGPFVVAIVNALTDGDQTYRQLIATRPYKYVGYVVGGSFLGLGLIRLLSDRLRLNAFIAVGLAITIQILIFDVLLNNISLPPNGDF